MYIELFLEQIFPDKELRNYFLDIYSTVGNRNNMCVLWVGEGNNGKSSMVEPFKLLLQNHKFKNQEPEKIKIYTEMPNINVKDFNIFKVFI